MKLTLPKPKVKRGQIWRRNKDGEEIEIVGTNGGDTFRIVAVHNRKKQHHITKKTLWLYYELV